MSKNVLIACEESQAVCIEFRKLGIEAFSCDIQDCSGGHPEWHFQQDIFEVIKGGRLIAQSGESVYIEKWDMMIAFPPCTHLAVSGAAWFEQKRKDGRQQEGIDFFLKIANADIPRIAVENPVGIMSKIFRKPDQVIQPYYFGDEAQKTTCLWLKNMPKLLHLAQPNLFESEVTHVGKGEFITHKSGKKKPKWFADAFSLSKEERAKVRSATFLGIAKAMATQWSKVLLQYNHKNI